MTGQTWLRRPTRSRDLIVMSVLFFAALVPRLTAVNRYITPDELIWVFRSVHLHQALASEQWWETLTAGHPGVTTTWLGATGISLQLLLHPEETAVLEWVMKLAWFAPENMVMYGKLNTFLTSGRVIAAIVNSLGVVLFFRFSRLLFGSVTAILASLLLAWDPFLAGLSGLLHVDGLMTTFASLALLTLALSLVRRDDDHWKNWAGFPILTGVFTGLALLTKTPALLLLPFCGLFFFLSIWQNRAVPFYGRLRRVLIQGISWLGSCLITVFLLFPALWVSPVQVFSLMSGTSNRHIEEAMRPTFFLGESVFDPGFLFYPVTILFRLSPIVFCGLILTIILVITAVVRRQKDTPWFQLPTWIFIVWPVLFALGISVAAKKFDRYALPIIPSLILLASLGWVWLPALQKISRTKVVAILAGLQALLLIWFLPYPLSAVNMALGGPWIGQRVLDVGWGEAVSEAAKWAALQPGADSATAVTGIPPAFAPFFDGMTQMSSTESLPQARYVVVSVNGEAELPEVAGKLVHTIHYNGLDRALIFEQANLQPPLRPAPIADSPVFGDMVKLLAFDATPVEENIRILLTWQLTQPSNGRYNLNLTLKDQQGHQWAQTETSLLNEINFYPEHWQDGETPTGRYELALPPGLPPGEYMLEVALFNETDGSQLPWQTADGAARGLAFARSLTVSLPVTVAELSDFEPLIPLAEWLDGRLQLRVPADFPPDLVVTGGEIVLDLIWQAHAELPDGLQVEVGLGDAAVTRPLSQFDSDRWRAGEIIQQKVTLPVPSEAEAGAFAVQIRPVLADGTLLDAANSEAEVEIIAIDRLFTLPVDVPILREDNFADWVRLAGVDVPGETAVAGTDFPLTLYWQIETVPSDLVSVFVHLLGPNGEILTQSDQWPGGLPVDLWADGQIIVDQHLLRLPEDLAAGSYDVAVGLYWTDSGIRLPISDTSDAVLLPVPVQVESRP